MSEIILETQNVFKRYTKDYVLKEINFQLLKGEFISIMGPSGSGKTTFLNCISTLDEVSKGKVLINGKSLGQQSTASIAQFRYESLGFVFQNANLLEPLTNFDNIATPLVLAKEDTKLIKEKVYKIAQQLNIEELLEKYPGQCSGGQQQRVAIARAIVNNPSVIIADEPTGNLDSENTRTIMKILTDLNKDGISIILVTHDNLVASFSSKLCYLKDGEISQTIERAQLSQTDYLDKINDITRKDGLLSLMK